MRGISLVLQAVVIEEFAVEHQRLVQLHSPRGSIGLRIVDRNFDFQIPVRGPPDPLVLLPCSVNGFPLASNQRPSRKPVVSTTRMSPSLWLGRVFVPSRIRFLRKRIFIHREDDFAGA